MKISKQDKRPAPRQTEFQRFAKAARKAGLIVSKKAYDAYFRAEARTVRKVRPDAVK